MTNLFSFYLARKTNYKGRMKTVYLVAENVYLIYNSIQLMDADWHTMNKASIHV